MTRAATLFDADAASYSGTVEVLGVIYKADDDGYAVLEVQETESGEGFALVGPVAHLDAGDRAEVSGEWQTHNRYGRQLRAQGALPLDPADREGQVAYLTSLRHIGQKRAERLCDEHGEGVLQAIAADPQRVFGSLRGVSADQAAAATQSWYASRAIRDLHVQLAPHGLAHLAAPIHARYGEHSMTVLHEDPYRLTEVPGVGFARADKIALAADVPPESSRRAQAAALYALIEAEAQGNSYLPLEELARRTARLIGLAPDPDVLVEARGLVEDEGRIYRAGTLESERAVAATLAVRAARAGPPRPRSRRDAARRPHRRAVGGGAGGLRGAGLGPHRRPRRRQDQVHEGDRRRGRSGERDDRPLRPDRPRRAAAGGSDRPRGDDDPPPARVDAGARAGLPAGAAAAGRPGDRRRVLDAEPAARRGAARRRSPRAPTSSSSATPTSCRRSAPASRSRT